MKEEKKKKLPFAVTMLVFPIAVLFMEFMIRVTSELGMDFGGIFGMIATAIAFGFVIDLICVLTFSDKAGAWVGFALTELLTVWFLIAYFTDNAYQVFMDLASVFGEAGNVVKGFGDTLMTIFTKGAPIILLFHVPSVLCLVFKRFFRFRTEKQIIPIAVLFVLAAAAGIGGYFLSNATDELHAKYTDEYTYDGAVRTFGVLTALELDVSHVADSNSAEKEIIFAPVEPEPEREPEPAPEPEPVEPEQKPEEDLPEEPVEPEPAPIVYGDNVMDIDFDALMASAPDSTIASIHQYVSQLTPTKQNEYTGLFKGKNLILITAESFTKEIIDKDRTPTLYRLATKGIVMEDFYQPAWGGSTSTGEYSFLMGNIPTTASAMSKTKNHNLYFTLGNQLQREGYYSHAYHNGEYEYYKRHLTHRNLGYTEYTAIGNGLEKGLTSQWPSSDLEMIQYTLPDYIDEEHFSVYYMSVSGHCNYTFSTGTNAMSVKNKAVTDDMEYSHRVRAYYACNQELENALSYLVQQLEEKGIADDTVIAICSDHYPYGLERSTTWDNTENYLYELFGVDKLTNLTRDHNAGIIWCGCLEDREEPIVVSKPTYSLDMVPTLSNLFGLEYDSRLLVGQDMLSDNEGLVLWMDYSWLTDKGYYNGSSGKFTPNEGVEVDDDYVEKMKQTVKNKMAFSKATLNYDYYGMLFGEDDVT